MAIIEITPASLRDKPLPQVGGEADKNSRGRVLVIGSSAEVAGAAVLAGVGALRAGAGKLRFGAPDTYATALALRVPEAMVIAAPANDRGELSISALERLRSSLESMDAVVVGAGMLAEESAGPLAAAMLETAPHAAFVVDAAALTGLRHVAKAADLCAGRAVLTPHAGEMAKLMGMSAEAVTDDPVGAAVSAAARFKATVVLKGAETHVATPEGQVWRNSGGVSSLGVSGSGDVLSGVIGGLLARGAAPSTAAIWAVYAHAQAGRRLSSSVAPQGFLAREILDCIPRELALAAL